jgi:hypothetical protein
MGKGELAARSDDDACVGAGVEVEDQSAGQDAGIDGVMAGRGAVNAQRGGEADGDFPTRAEGGVKLDQVIGRIGRGAGECVVEGGLAGLAPEGAGEAVDRDADAVIGLSGRGDRGAEPGGEREEGGRCQGDGEQRGRMGSPESNQRAREQRLPSTGGYDRLSRANRLRRALAAPPRDLRADSGHHAVQGGIGRRVGGA